jgi:glucose-1-phosphate thymidylyltransferase
MKAILLAAGYATRLYPLTENFPKALLSVGGAPLLDHIVRQLDKIDEVDEIHVVSNEKFYPHFAAWAAEKKDGRLHVHNDGTRDDATKRGAIGDIAFVQDCAGIDDDCLVVAGDNLLMIDYQDFYAAYLAHGRNTLLLAQKMADRKTLQRFAVAELDADCRVTHLVEKPQDPPSDNGVFALYLYPAPVMRLLKDYLAQGNSPDAPGHFPVWLVDRAPVYAYVTDKPCYDIGTHESLELVRRLYGA